MTTDKCINELPAEVLGMVFFEFIEQGVAPAPVPGLRQRQRCPHPGRLSGVCRLWRVLVEGCPDLWSCIEAEVGGYAPMKIESIRTRIQRAKQSPLALYIHCERQMILPSAMMITRDVVALYGLIKGHRWCALSIFNPDFLSPFEIIFRHILDNPQMCRISSFRMESSSPYFERNVEVARTLAREALQQDLGITRLAIPMNLLDPSHPLLQAVSYLQLLGGWSQRDVLSSIREASSLRSLRVDSILRGSEDESTPVTTLLELEHLDLRNHQKFPKLLMQKLDLPNIHTLKLSSIQCSSIKQGDEQLRSLLESVPWMARVKAFSLEDVGITEEALLWMLRGLPLLEDLALSSAGRVSCKTTNALSQPPTARRGWLCPRLEVIKFGECRPLQERSVVALVRARVRDIPNTTPDGVTEPNLLPPVRLRKVVWRGRDMV